MSAKTSRKNRSWAKTHLAEARAAANLRAKGISEARIYKALRHQLKEAPSYRDLRAAFAQYGATHGKLRGQKDRVLSETGRLEREGSQWKTKLKAQYTEDGRERLARNFALREHIRQHVGKDGALTDMPRDFLQTEVEREYFEWADEGGYFGTPPV